MSTPIDFSSLTYEQFVDIAKKSTDVTDARLDAWIRESAKYDISEMQAAEDYFNEFTGLRFNKNANGTYDLFGWGNTYQVSSNAMPNSNLTSMNRGNLTRVLNRNVSQLGKLEITKAPASGGLAANASYWLGSANAAIMAAGVGIKLGKTIDSVLYNLNPNFWDERGMSAINPETWGSITNGDTSLQAGLFNYIFGIDPVTGKTQPYMDANAFALLAMYMNEQGIFTEGEGKVTDAPSGFNTSGITFPISLGQGYRNGLNSALPQYRVEETIFPIAYRENNNRWHVIPFSATSVSSLPYLHRKTTVAATGEVINDSSSTVSGITSYTFNNQTVYYTIITSTLGGLQTPVIIAPNQGVPSSNVAGRIAWLALYNATTPSPVDGIGNQEGATLPDTSTWNDIPSTLQSLQNQYPDMFDNAIVWDNVQPDGSNPQLTYIPVPMPDFVNADDTKPTSSSSTQTDTAIDSTTGTLTQLLMQLLQQQQTQTQTETGTIPQNPVDTGTGDTASPILPVGSASALWSVYHPTQAQVNAFGAWLWSSPFETNIGKLFQNPIEGVISLHKVFAPPVDSGTQNIVVGTLDSGVSSATVNQQYVTVDCGSIDCYEDFGNVFDYPPFTSVSIYLPFIGIMPLDANDVMRSTVHVVYGVDIFTGACLAMVEVSRDGNTVNMYQYSGVCSASYPITNIQYSQTLTGILAITSGMAMGGLAGAMTIAGGALSTAKGTVGRSSNFSGNAGAMGIKTPYLILQRPQTKVADNFPSLAGYPTNVSGKLSQFGGQVRVTDVHVEGINATQSELAQIEDLLKSGVLISD